MKKNYVSPEFELVEMELNCALLAESDTTGGGIGDDNSGSQSGETPANEFEW